MRFDRNFGKILLTEDNNGVPIPEHNTITLGKKSFELRSLTPHYRYSKGGNSSVFILHDLTDGSEDKVVKISNYYKVDRRSSESSKRRYGRFLAEIEALRQIKEHTVGENVVTIFEDDVLEIDGFLFPYYVMERADSDLKKYLIDDRKELDLQEKIKLCYDIFKGIRTIHSLNYYHRDIKPDNIFLFYNKSSSLDEQTSFTWKVGDLGLARHRDKDYDDIGEKIGPLGWLSPEAMNKYLTERAQIGFDCMIDQASDIFQLGKLFWFIFNLNVPIGQIRLTDFKENMPPHGGFLFEIITDMLQYSKERRCKKETLEEYIEMLATEVGV
jgi:serine/threonine protein kinase